MPLQIEIKENHIDSLIEFYLDKQKKILAEINVKDREVKDIGEIIKQLKQAGKSAAVVGVDSIFEIPKLNSTYNDKWPWQRKIFFALDEAKKPLTTKEIVDILIDYEPIIHHDRKKAVASISSILSTKSGDYSEKKDFIKSISETGEFAYSIWNERKKDKEKSVEDFFNDLLNQ